MPWNIVKVSDMLLGESPEDLSQAVVWQSYYEKKYPGIKFAVVETSCNETCDVPPIGVYRAFGSQQPDKKSGQ